MGYTIEELRDMLTEWAGWGETMAQGRIGSDGAGRFLAMFEDAVRESEREESERRGYNKGYSEANREWQTSGDGRGFV